MYAESRYCFKQGQMSGRNMQKKRGTIKGLLITLLIGGMLAGLVLLILMQMTGDNPVGIIHDGGRGTGDHGEG